jgi:hypothetical protein
MMHLVLVVDIDGDVDQSGLERLRSHLGLKKQGRLSDDWDQEFGYRKIVRSTEQYANIGLFRNFDGTWIVQVLDTERLDPTVNELAVLRAELVEGITAAGYQATVRAKPTFGSAQ